MSLSSCGWRLSVAPLAGVERQRCRSLGSGGHVVGISHSLPSDPHIIQGTHPLPCAQPFVYQGQGLGRGGSLSVGEGSNRAGSPSVYSQLFVVMKASGSWRPVINLSLLNLRGSQDIFQVSTSFGTGWRLDGVSRLEGCVLCKFRCIRSLASSSDS